MTLFGNGIAIIMRWDWWWVRRWYCEIKNLNFIEMWRILILVLYAGTTTHFPLAPPWKSSKSTMASSFCLTMAVFRHLWTQRPAHPQGHHIFQRLFAGFCLNRPSSGTVAASHRRQETAFGCFHHCVSSRSPWHLTCQGRRRKTRVYTTTIVVIAGGSEVGKRFWRNVSIMLYVVSKRHKI